MTNDFKKVTVYLKTVPNFMPSLNGNINLSDYKKVAVIDAPDAPINAESSQYLENAFMKSQNVHDAWLGGENVTPEKGVTSARSSSVGDVFELNGRFYEIDNVGFKMVRVNQ